MVIEAASELTVQAGGSFIKLDAGGISVNGAQVKVNAGGAAGKGAGIALLMPRIPIPAGADRAGNLLESASPGVERPRMESAPRDYFFKIQLTDIPGDEGFPLAYTPWAIFEGDEDIPLLEGASDEEGRITLDEDQRRVLSNAVALGTPLWLSYPGQRVALLLHQEPSAPWQEQAALAALDFHGCLKKGLVNKGLVQARSQQDTLCEGDIYRQLQSRED
ncbi:hypothetical protein C1883_31565 [Pseudomonas protegens]|nr:hypothetical protein C1883_31565 [Pseudomonas protegens]